jgi:hypothetical protein|tara:strand:+ start:475 stop:681 length:207 start_codon:yes stop_codon:yes gene_type:complete
MSKNWDSIRAQYQGILKNLLNNIDICNERYLKEGEMGYMIQRDVYIKELTEMKTMIKRKENEQLYTNI